MNALWMFGYLLSDRIFMYRIECCAVCLFRAIIIYLNWASQCAHRFVRNISRSNIRYWFKGFHKSSVYNILHVFIFAHYTTRIVLFFCSQKQQNVPTTTKWWHFGIFVVVIHFFPYFFPTTWTIFKHLNICVRKQNGIHKLMSLYLRP